MRWNVEGADARTGTDRLVTIEAEDEQSAEEIARAKGMLIAAVHPVKVMTAAEKLERVMAGELDASTVTAPTPVEHLAAEWNARVTEHKAQKMHAEGNGDPDAAVAHAAAPESLTTSTLFTSATTEAANPHGGAKIGGMKIGLDYRHVLPRLLRMRARHPSEPVPQYAGLHVASIVLGTLAILSYGAGVLKVIETILELVRNNWSWNAVPSLLQTISILFGAITPIIIGAVLHGLSAGCAALRDIAQNSFNR